MSSSNYKSYSQQLFPDPSSTDSNNKRKNFHEADQKLIDERENEILAFGYECKLYNDENTALKIHNGESLIPWKNHDEQASLLMDRFDVRHLIDNLDDLCDIAELPNKNFEQMLNLERYADLYQQNTEEEPPIKKSKNTAAIPYKYDENSYNEIQRTILTKYKTPSSMIIPATEEQMSIIEQVAKHANSAKDSNLFEIQVQVKNSTNSLYSFLNKQDPLYSFYKHVQWLNRLGNYYSSDSEEEEEDKGINIPSLETQQIIDKTAKYIAKSSNGAELEKRLKERKNHDPKFGFIHPDHLYHSFYKSKIKEYKDTCK